MPQIKIDVPGWEAFNGFLGPVEFKDGVSVDTVSQVDIKRLGASIKISELNGEQVGPAMTYVESRFISAAVEKHLATEEDEAPANDSTVYTEVDLIAIAEAKGIKGVREIAKQYDVKGVAIADLISGILEAQKRAD